MRITISTPPRRCWTRFVADTPAPKTRSLRRGALPCYRHSRFRVQIQFQGLVLEPFDLLQRFAGNTLEIAVHSNRAAHDALDLLFAFRPLLRDHLAFPLEVPLHRGESLDDRLDPLAESRTGQILIDHFGFRLLPFGSLPRQLDLQQRVAQDRRHRQHASRMGDPHAIDQVEGFDALRQHAAHENANLGLGGTLVFPQLREPRVAPIPGSLGLPQNRAAELPARALDALHDIAAELALRHRLDAVERKLRAQQSLQLELLNLALKLLRAPLRLVLQFFDGPLHR